MNDIQLKIKAYFVSLIDQ